MKISGIEVFIKAPDIQFFQNIKIVIGVPYSEIFFKKKDFEKAIKAASIKSLGGFNDENDCDLYLNNEIINKKEIMFWENYTINNFIKEKEKKLKEDNKITIEHKNLKNFEYFKHIIIYEEGDDESLEKELKR
jgi:hypothetical protein